MRAPLPCQVGFGYPRSPSTFCWEKMSPDCTGLLVKPYLSASRAATTTRQRCRAADLSVHAPQALFLPTLKGTSLPLSNFTNTWSSMVLLASCSIALQPLPSFSDITTSRQNLSLLATKRREVPTKSSYHLLTPFPFSSSTLKVSQKIGRCTQEGV